MREQKEIDRKTMRVRNEVAEAFGTITALFNMPSGTQAELIYGRNEGGYEHVSVKLRAKRLPTWEEMCLIKDIFWYKEEEVVQIHPRKSHYVNITEALHLWRPVDVDWSIMNKDEAEHE